MIVKHDLVPARLRCEYRIDPQGIDIRNPRLSWIVEGPDRGRRQTAYRVLAASAPEALTEGIGDLWDTGKVRSDTTAHIEYQGRSLRSRQPVYWQVAVWDEKGRGPVWSKPACWSMGLLKTGDWKAQWIGFDKPLQAARRKPARDTNGDKIILPAARCLRKELSLAKPVKRAMLYSSGLGIYDIYINGRRMGDEYFKPGWTDYDKRIYYWTHDVTGLLKKGVNAIAGLLAEGWYAGYVGFGRKRDHYGNKLRLRAQLHIEYKDGTEEVIASDRSWKASTGPVMECDFLKGEMYDARKEQPGWDQPGFSDRKWQRVNTGTAAGGKLQAALNEPVRIFREIKPKSVREPKPGAFVFNMGTNFAGIVRLKVKGKRGQKIVLRFAEMLNPDGTLYTTNLRSARAIDTYICKGEGTETWAPQFTFHGFQYVEVTGLPQRPAKSAITGLELTSTAPMAGGFTCSDPAANQLYHNICQTQRANFIDIPTDCPQRDERLGWTGDAQIYIQTATYNNDVAAFFTKWLVDLEDGQGADGNFPDVAPRKVAMGGGTAAWGDAGLVCPWVFYRMYGDARMLKKHYRAMTRWISYCKKNSTGLIRPAAGYGDWLSIKADTPKDLLATAYFAHSTDLMARIADVLGKKKDAIRYGQLFKKIRAAFNRAFVSEHGRMQGDTQTAYVLALAFNLLDARKRKIAIDHLVHNVEERDGCLSTGFVGTKDLMGVLDCCGRNDTAYALFHNDAFPSWGFSVKHGATSIWERWNGWTPEGFFDPGMNSFAHYAFGAVGEWMFRVIGGIDTDGPAFEKIVIKPVPGGKLRSASVEHTCIRGDIRTAWRRSGKQFRLDVTVPANTVATIHVPGGKVTEGGKTLGTAKGLKTMTKNREETIVKAGSGSYRFKSTMA